MRTSDENIKVLITKHLANEADEEQIRIVENWLKISVKNRQMYKEYEKIWNEIDVYKHSKEIDIDVEWEKMEARISNQKVGKKNDNRLILLTLSKIAAAAVVVLAVIFGVRYISGKSYSTYSTTFESGKLVLPDSSVVTLNGYSEIKYPRKFSKKNRSVMLNGEAYFEIKPVKEKLFTVESGDVNIVVLGTSFNVNAYEENEEVEVVVNSGRVAMSIDLYQSNMILLESGNKGAFSKQDGKLSKTLNTDINYLAWKTRKLIFVNEEFGQIIETINKVYQSKISIKNKDLIDCRVTSTFDQLSLDAVLKILESTLDLEVVKTDSLIIITGEGC